MFHKQFKKVSKGPLSKFQGGLQERFKDVSRTFHRTFKCLSRVFQRSFKTNFQVFQRCFKHYWKCFKVVLFLKIYCCICHSSQLPEQKEGLFHKEIVFQTFFFFFKTFDCWYPFKLWTRFLSENVNITKDRKHTRVAFTLN